MNQRNQLDVATLYAKGDVLMVTSITSNFLTMLVSVSVGFSITELISFLSKDIDPLVFVTALLLVLITLLTMIEHWRMYTVILKHPPLVIYLDFFTIFFATMAIHEFLNIDCGGGSNSREMLFVIPCFYLGAYLFLATLRFVIHDKGLNVFKIKRSEGRYRIEDPQYLPLIGNALGAILGFVGSATLYLGWLDLKAVLLWLVLPGVGVVILFVTMIELHLVGFEK